MKLKLLGLGGVAAAATIGLSPLAASATTVSGTAIVFTGATTSLTPVSWVGPDSGSYQFNSNAGLAPLCLEFELEADTPPVPPAVEESLATPCNISASGSYTNIVCGTGWTGGALPGGMGDTALISDDDGANSATIHYGIVFVASVGIVVGTGTETDGDTGPVAGVVQINALVTPPSPTPPSFGTCTSSFNVEGVVAAVGSV